MQDDDGDRWGRDLIALADGRFLVVWVVAGDRSVPSQGINYCISEDGKTWDAESTVTLMPDTMIVGRYSSPRLCSSTTKRSAPFSSEAHKRRWRESSLSNFR